MSKSSRRIIKRTAFFFPTLGDFLFYLQYFIFQYLPSLRFLELLCYLAFGLVSSLVCNFTVPLTVREIPYQVFKVGDGQEILVRDFALSSDYIPSDLVTYPDIK